MSKICPISKEKVLYLDCLECEEKKCKNAISSDIIKEYKSFDNKSNHKIEASV